MTFLLPLAFRSFPLPPFPLSVPPPLRVKVEEMDEGALLAAASLNWASSEHHQAVSEKSTMPLAGGRQPAQPQTLRVVVTCKPLTVSIAFAHRLREVNKQTLNADRQSPATQVQLYWRS